MARLAQSRNLAPVLEAAQQWIQNSIIQDKSVFTEDVLWTKENVEEVRRAFVEHPDEGTDSFSTKLQGQMKNASRDAQKLMAEMIWGLLLFPSNISRLTKRNQVGSIWGLTGEKLSENSPFLGDNVLLGIGSGGPGFNTHRWREMVFLLTLVGDLKQRDSVARKNTLADYQNFIKWIDQVPDAGQRQFRHMLRYFCFPDRVERMSSNTPRYSVLEGFNVATKKESQGWSDEQLDQALFDLRHRLESEYPGVNLDFYEPPLDSRWRKFEESEDEELLPPKDVRVIVSEPLDNLTSSFEDSCENILRIVDGYMVRFSSALLSKRFLVLTGLAGSGKTKLAQAFSRWITPSHLALDAFSPGTMIQSANVTYYVKRSDELSVEFWNNATESDATKVSLPREMISEWATYIHKNAISPKTQAREIREAVKVTSKFSDQLHSFETHLKAAAFALLNSQLQDANGSCYSVVPVGADWTGNENILGYPDGLDPKCYVAKPALNLILHAAEHPNIPHFLVLDEMNLSHVERYFADILSIIESDEGLELYSGGAENQDTWRQTSATQVIPPRLRRLPDNLFIIGTVNVDETTYMFSPKVLDRANVIEFRMDAEELDGFLSNPVKPDLAKLDGKGASFGKAFVDAAKSQVSVPSDVKAAYDDEMLLLFKTLQTHGAEFGYRTAYETARFIHFYKLLGNHEDGDTSWFRDAFDCVVFQKLLPKLHGSRAKLGPILKKLWFLCVNDKAGRGADVFSALDEAARSSDKKYEPSAIIPTDAPYPMSAEKIYRMWRLMMDNGFASFAEA